MRFRLRLPRVYQTVRISFLTLIAGHGSWRLIWLSKSVFFRPGIESACVGRIEALGRRRDQESVLTTLTNFRRLLFLLSFCPRNFRDTPVPLLQCFHMTAIRSLITKRGTRDGKADQMGWARHGDVRLQ
jgi:hypothetical protein